MLSKGPENPLGSGHHVFQFQLNGDLSERQFVVCLQQGQSSVLTAFCTSHNSLIYDECQT